MILAAAALVLASPPVVERVEVRLVEAVFRVTDRKGRPLEGLLPTEVEVREGGETREVAFVEPFLASERGPATSIVTLYDGDGRAVPEAETPVLPPRPARRFVLAFDLENSRARARPEWGKAAAAWIRSSLRPGDRVAVVLLRSTPEWRLPFTDAPEQAAALVESLDLRGLGIDRDRGKETSILWSDIESCASAAEAGGSGRGAADPRGCAVAILEPLAEQWGGEAREAIGALGTLVGELAAIPGRKQVLLFSDGFFPDPAAQASSAFLALFGSDRRPPPGGIGAGLGPDVAAATTRLFESAAAAGVAFYPFDTRSPADRGTLDTLELDRSTSARALGANPWEDAYRATSGTLAALAEESGGRPSWGAKDLPGKLDRASGDYDALWVVGFYRPAGADAGARLRIGVSRGGTRVEHPRRAAASGASPRPFSLQLSIRPPEATGRGDRQWLPVVVDVPVGSLPFRRVDGTWGCRVAFFLQAYRPDGSVLTEAFHEEVVAFDDAPGADDPRWYRQLVRLEIPPGPVRVRARVTDDRLEVLADRAIDLTLGVGAVRGGITPPG